MNQTKHLLSYNLYQSTKYWSDLSIISFHINVTTRFKDVSQRANIWVKVLSLYVADPGFIPNTTYGHLALPRAIS